MKLTFINDTAAGDINVPVLRTMTNEDVAEGIFKAITPQNGLKVARSLDEVNKYVETLRNAPDEVFIDPCYDVCPDIFILSFELEN